jgi:hypothetical protein
MALNQVGALLEHQGGHSPGGEAEVSSAAAQRTVWIAPVIVAQSLGWPTTCNLEWGKDEVVPALGAPLCNHQRRVEPLDGLQQGEAGSKILEQEHRAALFAAALAREQGHKRFWCPVAIEIHPVVHVAPSPPLSAGFRVGAWGEQMGAKHLLQGRVGEGNRRYGPLHLEKGGGRQRGKLHQQARCGP